MNREKQQKPIQNPRKWQLGITAVYGLAVVTFFVALFLLDVLPLTYFLIAAVFMGIISALLVHSLIFSKAQGKKPIVCAVIAGILALCLIVGTIMISGTLSFFQNILSGNVQTYEFYAVVREDSTYEKLEDISGETVSVLDVKGDIQKMAEQELAEKVDVDFQRKADLTELANGLIEKSHHIILLSSAYYDMAIEDVEGFTEKNTRILDSITIRIERETDSVDINLTEEPFNVYISGIDATGVISNASRSDVNMVMTVNPKEHKILLTSIPRDYYVVLAGYDAYDKLTHAGIYGIEESKATVEKLLDMEIHHYVKVNFTTVTKLVDALGGIAVDSEYAFTSRDGFQFVKGENQLNGEQALSFARERKAFADGDNQRVKNQQAVISGIINKATGSTAILTQYSSLLGALADNMETSLTKKDITSLVKMQLGDMRGWQIEKISMTGSGSSAEVYSMPGWSVYVMEPKSESVEKAKARINEIMYGTENATKEQK